MVFKFTSDVTQVASASVSASDGSDPGISGAMGDDPTEYIVTLTGVNNEQVITVTLTGIDLAGDDLASAQGVMSVLLGDVDGSERVDGGDVLVTRQQSLRPIGGANFRADINRTARIDGADTLITRQRDFDGTSAARRARRTSSR